LYKATLLLSPCLLVALFAERESVSAWPVFLFYVNVFLYLEFAYLANDYADREDDLAAGKRRSLSRLSKPVALVVIAGAAAANVIVALILTRSLLYVSLLFVGLAFGWVYSVEPFRIKARGIWGVIFAPALGKVLPILMACSLYRCFAWWIILLILADWLKNAIDILFHQVVDYEVDRRTGVHTYVVVVGRARAEKDLAALALLGIPAALILACLYAVLIPEYRSIFALTVLGGIFWNALKRKRRNSVQETALSRLLPASYLYYGCAVFLLSPAWLSLIACLRNVTFLPVVIIVAAVTIFQTLFYLRYQYR